MEAKGTNGIQQLSSIIPSLFTRRCVACQVIHSLIRIVQIGVLGLIKLPMNKRDQLHTPQYQHFLSGWGEHTVLCTFVAILCGNSIFLAGVKGIREETIFYGNARDNTKRQCDDIS